MYYFHAIMLRFIKWYLKSKISLVEDLAADAYPHKAQINFDYKSYDYWAGYYCGLLDALEELDL